MDPSLWPVCDGFYASARLFLKLDLTLRRETLLHFFDRIRKEYPELGRLRHHEKGGLILEEGPADSEPKRWVRIDADSPFAFGHFSPVDLDEVRRLGDVIMTQAPYYLTFSEIDYDHLELLYGFDLQYQGNHDQLIADTLWGDRESGGFLFGDETAHIIDAQPYFGVALTPDCDLQAYVEVKSRTSSYEVRNDAYEAKPISVYLTLRKYFSVKPPASLNQALVLLFDHADELATEKVVPRFVNPLAAAIASRP